MVAFVSGNNLGVVNNSLGLPNGQSIVGNAGLGRANEQVYVNTATGNLVVQRQDELLIGQGPDIGLVRTYNSQGLLNDDNGDNWRLGIHKRLYGLTGSLKTTGSTIKRTDADGAELLYVYDSVRALYVNKEGAGSYDTLNYNNTTAQWTWTDGDTRVTETYDWVSGNGKLLNLTDLDSKTLTYTYTDNLLTLVTDASGEKTYLDYTSNNLIQIRIVQSDLTTITRTRYSYDANNRLTQVITDLTPDDSTIADGNVYLVTYTYDGNSNRINSISQTDGSTVNFGYSEINGTWRITSIVDALGKTTLCSYTDNTTPATSTKNRNGTAVSTTETQTTNTTWNLNSNALIGWENATLRESLNTAAATSPQITYDQNGNGLAVWALGTSLYASSYTSSGSSWSAETVLDGALTGTPTTPNLAMSQNGNALVTWVQNGNIYARRYITGIWEDGSAVPLLEDAAGAALNPVGAINDAGHAVVSFIQTDGTRHNLMANIYNGTVWQTTATNLDDLGTANTNTLATTIIPSVALDGQNNATVLWLQKTGTQTSDSLLFSRYDASTSSWSNANSTTIESTTTAVTAQKIGFDAAGNGLAVWLQGTQLYGKVYTNVTNSWGPATTLSTNATGMPSLSISGNGNALATWVQGNNIYARRFANNAWIGTAAELLENLTGVAAVPVGSINDSGQAVVVFIQSDGSLNNLYANRFTGTAWSGSVAIENNANTLATTAADTPSVAIDANGNINTVWLQKSGSQVNNSVFSNHYNVLPASYYSIPQGATWASIASTLYGSANVASQLQTALGNPPLTAGNRLTGLPASLTYTVTSQVTVPPYYTVQEDSTWTSITSAVYGTSDPAAVSALQAATGNPALTAGLKLAMPATISYLIDVFASVEMRITDALGNQTTFTSDNQRRLARIDGPAVANVHQTVSYVYNVNGDIVSHSDAQGRITNFQYDANGNQILRRDAAGNTTARTYGSKNQLLTETVYLIPDPDGAGALQPDLPQTTWYSYDTKNHLRFVVSPEGRVNEYRYNALGQLISNIHYADTYYAVSGLDTSVPIPEADLKTWVASTSVNKTFSVRVDTSYDFRGQINTVTRFTNVNASGVGIVDGKQSVTKYVYDQSGLLLQTIAPKGIATSSIANDFVTSFTYDGLGRLLTTTDSLNNVAVTQYDDVQRKTITSLSNGLATTSVYGMTGELISVMQANGPSALGATQFWHDAIGRLRMTQDPTGVKRYVLYDEAGRKVADIDGNGSLTEYRYNRNNQVIQTVAYASALSATDLASLTDVDGNPAEIALSTIRPASSSADRSNWNLYDAANRLTKTIDALGHVTETQYDGASHVTAITRYATPINIAYVTDTTQSTSSAVSPTPDVVNDRFIRYFYDTEGRLLAILDAEGYLTEYRYDAAGRMINTTAYVYQTDEGARAVYTLGQFQAYSSQGDVQTWNLYDGQNRVVGTINAEGFLTETIFDVNGNATQKIAYATSALIAPESITDGTRIAALRPASTSQDRITSFTYNDVNQVQTQTNAEGTVTRYSYDSVGNLIKTDKAYDTTDVRTLQAQYDVQGRLTGELTAEGSVALSALVAPPQSEVDAILAQYGMHHAYDASGRRIATIDQNGNRTLFYYNADGNLTHTVNALGEVKENVYNALNQLTQTVMYGTRIGVAVLANLAGGLVNTALTGAVNGIANSLADSRVNFSYDVRGQLIRTTDELGTIRNIAHNAFGDVVATNETIDTAESLTTKYEIDHRGLRSQTIEDFGGLNRITKVLYDAFGRIVESTDANNQVSRTEYDGLGRVISTTDFNWVQTTTTYDAFDRILTHTDKNGATTSYAYDNAARSITLTSAEGIIVVNTLDRHGQTQTVKDGNGSITSYRYDKNGNLIQTDTALTQTRNIYDAAQHLIETTDANGNKVAYSYDAANRMLTRTVDPAGMNLVTSFQYDAKGRQIETTDANGVVTQTQFDLKGRTVSQTVNPTGLNLVTTYTYDSRGKVLTITQPQGTVQQYVYDHLGRRIEERVDPSGLSLITSYIYDNKDRVIAKTQPNGNITRYGYDEDSRFVTTVNANGDISQEFYDAEGRSALSLSYVNRMDLSGLPTAVDVAELQGRFPAAGSDAKLGRIYDQDGRLQFEVNGDGGVVEYVRDNNGNITDRISYANRGYSPSWGPAASTDRPEADTAHDLHTKAVYDVLNRPLYTMDATGAVIKQIYDGNGNVIERIAYAHTIPADTSLTQSAIDVAVAAIADSARDVRIRQVYDAANRLAWAVDGVGAVTHYEYDKTGKLVRQTSFANAVTANASPTTVVASSADRVTSLVYDAAGHLAYNIDATGGVTKQVYDGNGNVVQRIAYARPIATGFIPTIDGVESGITLDAENDRVSRIIHDNAGRSIFEIDPEGVLKKSVYDGVGNEIETLSYAAIIDISNIEANASVSDIQALIRPQLLQDRLERRVFDAAHRLVYSIDSLGRVKHTQHDGIGNIITTTRYAVLIPTTTPASQAAVAAAIQVSAQDQVNTFDYDPNGRLIESIDSLGHQEWFLYNALGQKIYFSNKSGNNYSASIWDYEYDAAGRLISEKSPYMELGGAALLNTDGSDSPLIFDMALRSLGRRETRMQYDALGNLTALIEGFGRPEARTTVYEYDALGRQIKTIYPETSFYDAGADNLTTNGLDGFAARVENNALSYAQVFYDKFGNAVANQDASGNFSYKAYDASGRLAFDVDAEGYVTEYSRNNFGEVATLTRYSEKTTLPARGADAPDSTEVRAALSALSHAGDRTIRTAFDHNGRIKEVNEPEVFTFDQGQGFTASKTSRNNYDAFGQLRQTSTLQNALTDAWAATTFYYDQAGRQVAEVDALGYATQKTIDVFDNVLEQTEFADAANSWSTAGFSQPTATADDRTIRYTYDKNNRKTSETLVNVEFSIASDGSSVRGDRSTSYMYNGAGNLTDVVDADGIHTVTTYDEIGHVTYVSIFYPVNEGSGFWLAAGVQTYFSLDIYGNVVYQMNDDYHDFSYIRSETLTRYDSHGNAVQMQDSSGNSRFFSYDENGRIAKQWQTVTNGDGENQTSFRAFKYDKNGNLTHTIDPASHAYSVSQVAAGVDEAITEYNAFGEIARRGSNGTWHEYFEYDKAGRLWRTNTGDGANKVVLYDNRGLASAEVRGTTVDLMSLNDAQQATNLTNARRTETQYDSLGRMASRTGAERNGIRPVISQKMDRWGNVIEVSDPRSPQIKTTYRYNFRNQIVEEQKIDTSVNPSATPAVTKHYFDGAGRRLATRDANGNLNAQLFDGKGNLVEEHHADGGVVSYMYDALDKQVMRTDTLGNVTSYEYNSAGQLTKIIREIADEYSNGQYYYTADTTYTYDQAGHRLSVTNANNETIRYGYDQAGNLVQTTQPLGQQSSILYDAQKRKVAEIDANGLSNTWDYDYFGRVTSHKDLGGGVATYTYNEITGQLQSLTNTRGQNLSFAYDGAGQIQQVTDHTLAQVTEYAYDAAGNRTLERTTQGGIVYQDNAITFDGRNRITDIVAQDGVQIHLEYDKVSNRLSERIDGGTAVRSRTLYYAYDSMNRQILVDGAVDNDVNNLANLTAGQGNIITYDTNGNRLSQLSIGTQISEQERTYLRANGSNFQHRLYEARTGIVKQTYQYDDRNRLTTVINASFDTNWVMQPDSEGIVMNALSYDMADRVLASGPQNLTQGYIDKLKQSGSDRSAVNRIINTYDGNGKLLHRTVMASYESPDPLDPMGEIPDDQYDYLLEESARNFSIADYQMYSDVAYGSYDAAGNVLSYSVQTAEDGLTKSYQYTYAHFDSYKEVALDGTRSDNLESPGRTVSSYDANGNLVSVADLAESTEGRYNRSFINDIAGHILQKNQQGNLLKELVVAGHVFGTYGSGVDPNKPVNEDGTPNYISHDNFNLTYEQVDSGYPATSAGRYTVQAGDTLQGIAQAAYGDSQLWYLIADANGLSGNADLHAGETLSLPSRVSTIHNDADSFRPYNASDIISDTSPMMPAPPSDSGGCGAFGMIFVIIIAIVVTIFTAGAAAVAFAPLGTAAAATTGFSATFSLGASVMVGGAASAGVGLGIGMAAAAIGGAVGSAVSQGVAISMGLQDSFSWKGVALGAIGGAVSAGVGQVLGGAEALNNLSAFQRGVALVERAVIGNVLTQGIGVATGLQESFSWRAVAGAAVGAGVGAAVSHGLNANQVFGDGFGGSLARSAVSGFVAGVAARATVGGKLDYVQIAADAFGNALGGSIVEQIGQNSQQEQVLRSFRQSEIADRNLAGMEDSAMQAQDSSFLWDSVAGAGVGIGQLDSANRQQEMARFKQQANELQYELADLRIEINGVGSEGATFENSFENLGNNLLGVGKGILGFAADMAYETAAMAGDTTRIIGAFGKSVITGQVDDVPMYSSLGRSGISTGEALTDMVTSLVSSPFNVGYHGTTALMNGDYESLGRAVGEGALLFGGARYGKYGVAIDDIGATGPLASQRGSMGFKLVEPEGANTSGLTVATNPATGNPAAIARGMGELNSRQIAVLDQLPEFGSNTIVHKSFGQKDLSALTAATGDEFAMFSTGGRRLIYRGDATSVPITPDIAQGLAQQGWRWSSHVHPGYDTGVLRSSLGDQSVLRAMGGNQSAIYNSMGQRSIFTPAGDSLNGWMPW